MRAAKAKWSIADLEAAGSKMTQLGLGAEVLAKEGMELKDVLTKRVCFMSFVATVCETLFGGALRS